MKKFLCFTLFSLTMATGAQAALPEPFLAESSSAYVSIGMGEKECTALCVATCGKGEFSNFIVDSVPVRGFGKTEIESFNNAVRACRTINAPVCPLPSSVNTRVSVTVVQEYNAQVRALRAGGSSPGMFLISDKVIEANVERCQVRK